MNWILTVQFAFRRVPPELMKYGRDIDVEIEDKHDHDFEKPKRQVKAFVGQGHR